MNAEAMNEARFELPAEALGLICELVKKLGGRILENKTEEVVYISPPIPEKERPGRMLKGARIRAEMTQKELAEKIGVPQNHISDYERNKRKIPRVRAEELAKVLETVPSNFLSDE